MIDAHVHLIPRNNPFGLEFKFDFQDITGRFETKQELSKMVVMPMLSDNTDSLMLNQKFLLELETSELSNRILPLLWFHPTQISHELASKPRIAGIKFHPSISQKRINDAIEIVDLAASVKKPILIHCGRGELSKIDFVLRINEIYSDVKFVCAHMGGLANELILSALKLVKTKKQKENIFFDSSGCLNPMLIKKGIEILGADHIMFGTDSPFFDFDVTLFAIEKTNLNEEDLQWVLYKTANFVYG